MFVCLSVHPSRLCEKRHSHLTHFWFRLASKTSAPFCRSIVTLSVGRFVFFPWVNGRALTAQRQSRSSLPASLFLDGEQIFLAENLWSSAVRGMKKNEPFKVRLTSVFFFSFFSWLLASQRVCVPPALIYEWGRRCTKGPCKNKTPFQVEALSNTLGEALCYMKRGGGGGQVKIILFLSTQVNISSGPRGLLAERHVFAHWFIHANGRFFASPPKKSRNTAQIKESN